MTDYTPQIEEKDIKPYLDEYEKTEKALKKDFIITHQNPVKDESMIIAEEKEELNADSTSVYHLLTVEDAETGEHHYITRIATYADKKLPCARDKSHYYQGKPREILSSSIMLIIGLVNGRPDKAHVLQRTRKPSIHSRLERVQSINQRDPNDVVTVFSRLNKRPREIEVITTTATPEEPKVMSPDDLSIMDQPRNKKGRGHEMRR